jgi:hypothetical protein
MRSPKKMRRDELQLIAVPEQTIDNSEKFRVRERALGFQADRVNTYEAPYTGAIISIKRTSLRLSIYRQALQLISSVSARRLGSLHGLELIGSSAIAFRAASRLLRFWRRRYRPHSDCCIVIVQVLSILSLIGSRTADR